MITFLQKQTNTGKRRPAATFIFEQIFQIQLKTIWLEKMDINFGVKGITAF